MFAYMGELVEIVDSLENKVSKLLHKMELLHQANAKLKEELDLVKEENKLKQDAVLEWEEKYNSLKMANTMLGSNTSKTEAKLKINTLIRELDVCIAKLAD
jgi:chromosome segregation ATPase